MNYKRLCLVVVITSLVCGLGTVAITPGYAQGETTPLPTILPEPTATLVALPTPIIGNVVSFSDFGVTNKTLRGPYAAFDLLFGLPASWELTDDAELRLDLTNFLTGAANAQTTSAPATVFGGTLEVALNGQLLATLLIDQEGSHTVSIKVPPAAFVSARKDGLQDLDFFFESNSSCDGEGGIQPTTVIHSTSLFVLPHKVSAPPIDLSRLPDPIYRDSFFPDSALIVVPNQPTTDELQAALAVAAGFGEMTGEKLLTLLLPISKLTPELQAANGLIFVAKRKLFNCSRACHCRRPRTE